MAQFTIIADDLTGAADTGSCFAEAGFATAIPLRSDSGLTADVLAVSTESRDLAAPAAAAVLAQTVAALYDSTHASTPRWLYKKIDSALRGHPRDELLTTMTAAGLRKALVAPAFPAEGRTTLGGRQFVDGIPVEASRLGSPGATSDLIAVFAKANLPVHPLALPTIRAGPDAIRATMATIESGIAIADAEIDVDLAALAEAVADRQDWLLCGAAGFARQLAPVLPLSHASPRLPAIETSRDPVLVVAGSRHEATTRQIAHLQAAGFPVVRLDQATIETSEAMNDSIVAETAAALRGNTAVVLTTAGLSRSALGERSVAAILADIAIEDRVSDACGGLVLTGGDVAMAVCDGLRADAIRLHGDVLPGIPWGTLLGGKRPGLPIVTKAGSFGGDGALLTAVTFLHERMAASRDTAAD